MDNIGGLAGALVLIVAALIAGRDRGVKARLERRDSDIDELRSDRDDLKVEMKLLRRDVDGLRAEVLAWRAWGFEVRKRAADRGWALPEPPAEYIVTD